MYVIIHEVGVGFHCSVSIQDGTERWTSASREEAIRSVIRSARVLNGMYIREDDIEIRVINKSLATREAEDKELFDAIRHGVKVVLDYDDPRIKYRITKEECELIIKIREGDVVVRDA